MSMAVNTGKEGKKFEQAIKEAADKKGYYFLRLPDSNKFGQQGTQTRFTQQSPFDALMFDGCILYCLELKHTDGNSLSFPNPVDTKPPKGKTFMIKYHQIQNLLEGAKHPNVVAGLLIDFGDRYSSKGKLLDEASCWFVHINNFYEWAKNTDKKSINRDDVKSLGYKITKTKKKVNYSYDISDLTDIFLSYDIVEAF